MSIFAHVPLIPSDPIFGLNTAFQNDLRPFKVNLGVGSFKDSNLQPTILQSVKQAEEVIYSEQTNKEYLPIDGDREYIRLVQELLFTNQETLYGAQAIGGTGALKIGADFLRNHVSKKIYIPDPTWDNHRRLFSKAHFTVASYRYYNRFKNGYDHDSCCEDIKRMDAGSVILLHGACHNPTGCDPSNEEWEELCQLIKMQNVIPFFDAAYLGFSSSIEEDSWPLNHFMERLDCLVALSFSKNFGLYSERVGALYVNSLNTMRLKAISSAIKVIIRSQYSNPPSHGALIVKKILHDHSLKLLWLSNLEEMRDRICEMRALFFKKLAHLPGVKDEQFHHLLMQKGLFSFTGLNATQVEALIKSYGIYMPKNGRMNVAGLNSQNIDYVVKAIKELL